jgi:hypothetical protein
MVLSKNRGFYICLLDWKLLSKRRVFYRRTSVACVCWIGVVSYRVCMHVILIRENIVSWLIKRERNFDWRSNHNQWIQCMNKE